MLTGGTSLPDFEARPYSANVPGQHGNAIRNALANHAAILDEHADNIRNLSLLHGDKLSEYHPSWPDGAITNERSIPPSVFQRSLSR